MADIFVSYARVDKARVAPLVSALEAQGWSVWWDPEIEPGQEFDDRIAEEIDKARAVVVVWTPTSVASRWVRGEAREAADRRVLVPVRFEKARLPIDVRALHTIDLDRWNEDVRSLGFEALARALSRLLAPASQSTTTQAPVATDESVSIAVLPFINLSSDPEQEYFSDGLSEELINQLAHIRELRVVGRTSCFAFKGKNEDLRVIGQKLSVGQVLEGSVRKAGNRLRITAQLIKCRDGYHLWSETFDRELKDVFDVQEDIARSVAQAMGGLLGVTQTGLPGGTQDLKAYDMYLRARSQAMTLGPQPLRRAAELYREAVTRDPRFALAWAGLAWTIDIGTLFLPEAAAVLRADWDRAVEQAVTLAPDLWASQLALGQREVYRRHWAAGEEALNQAVQRAPRSAADASTILCYLLSSLGRVEDSIIQARAACATDPLSIAASTGLQIGLSIAGRDEEAEQEYRRSRDLPGDRTGAEHWALLRAWAREHSPESLREHVHQFISHSSLSMPVERELLELIDQPAAARARLHEVFEDSAYQDATRQFYIALWSAQFDDTDLTLAAARRAYVELHSWTAHLLWAPVYRATREDVRFKQLLRDLGIVDYWRQTGRWGDFARPVGNEDFEIIR